MNEEQHSSQWKEDALVKVLAGMLKDQRRGRIGTIVWRTLFVVGILANITVLAFFQSSISSKEPMVNHAAVVNVTGPIQAGEYQVASADNIIASLHKAFSAESVSGVILDINSPGGSPVQSARVYRELLRLKAQHPDKPVYAVAGDVAASGAYYIASAADYIYADPTSLVGSIGVIMSGFGFSELLDRVGIERRVYTAGESKAMMDPYSELDADSYFLIKEMLSDTHRSFISDVMATRGDRIKIPQDEAFSGKVWTGSQALEAGMIDGIGSPREVAKTHMGVDKLVTYSQSTSPFDRIMGRLTAQLATHVTMLLTPTLN